MSLDEATAAVRNAANWFWWVAGLSAVNSVATALESQYGMILGLGVTQIFDLLMVGALQEASGTGETIVKAVHLALVAGAVGFFYLMGQKARQLKLWAFVLGMLVYAADALIFVYIQDWIGVGFHAFVLFMIWGGYGIAKQIREHAARSPHRELVGG